MTRDDSKVLPAKAISELLDEVEALCRVYVGTNAESQQRSLTGDRLDRLNRLAKLLRADYPVVAPNYSSKRSGLAKELRLGRTTLSRPPQQPHEERQVNRRLNVRRFGGEFGREPSQ